MEKEEKELDLLDLLSIIAKATGNFFKGAIKYFMLTVIFSFKKVLYFIPFLLVGAGIAFYLTMPDKRKYRAEVILNINDGDAFTIKNITKSLAFSYLYLKDNERREEANVQLATLMNISPQEVAAIRNIEAFYLVDLNKNNTVDYIDYSNAFKEDTTNVVVRNQIAIRFESANPNYFYSIRDGFMYYLDNNSFLSQQRDTRQAQDKEFVRFLTAEIAALDSLRNIEYFQKGDKLTLSSKDGVMMVNSDKQLFQNQLIDLNNSKRYYEQRLETGSDVAFITSPLIIDNKPLPSRLKTLAVSLVASYFIGLVCLLLIFNRKKINKWIEA